MINEDFKIKLRNKFPAGREQAEKVLSHNYNWNGRHKEIRPNKNGYVGTRDEYDAIDYLCLDHDFGYTTIAE